MGLNISRDNVGKSQGIDGLNVRLLLTECLNRHLDVLGQLTSKKIECLVESELL